VPTEALFSKKSVSFPRFRTPERIQLVVQNAISPRPTYFPPIPLSCVQYFSVGNDVEHGGECSGNISEIKNTVDVDLLGKFSKLLNNGSSPSSILITLEAVGSKNIFSSNENSQNLSFSPEIPAVAIPSEISLTVIHMFK
jgi:hypothetical protein